MKFMSQYIIILLLTFLTTSLTAQVDTRRKAAPKPNIEQDLQRTNNSNAIVLPARTAAIYMEIGTPMQIDPSALDEKAIQSLLANQKMNCKLLLSIFNPATIARIHVKVGSVQGKSDVVSHTFNFDQKSTAPFTFDRDGKTVVLGLGSYTNLGDISGEVVLENVNGKRSAPKYFKSKG